MDLVYNQSLILIHLDLVNDGKTLMNKQNNYSIN